MAGDYSLGQNIWPGLGKAVEETGELNQVFGKIIANGGDTNYYDGTDLREKLVEEAADVIAATFVFIELNLTDEEQQRVYERAEQKYNQFMDWHEGDIG